MSKFRKRLNYEQQLDKDGNLGPTLVMAGEDLDEIPPIDSSQGRRLIGINVSNNRISELSPQLAGLKKLEFLILADNRFTSLPPSIGELSGLRSLNLSNNGLASLPDELEELEELQELILDGNRFESIPEVLFRMPRLREVHMQRNSVREIAPGIVRMASLKILVLDYNQVTAVPEALAKMRLDELWVQHNRVQTCPNNLPIKKLKLHDNPIDPIDEP